MKTIKLSDSIYWVGGIDWNLRNFHGYITQRGSTYNAYLIIDEKITLVDTVKGYLTNEMIDRIKQIVDPSKIDYVISNHVEMDHSGGLPEIMKIAKNATLITSPNGERGLKAHYKEMEGWKYQIVKSGDSINTGKYDIDFLLTPMVHWPDNMMSFLRQEKILFSNDSFGQHIATSERFDDQLPLHIILEEAQKYYANIVMPFGVQVQKELSEASKLDIKIIAPSHGIIWRSHIPEIVEKYKSWSSNTTKKRAIIVYDTMWGSTEKIAGAIQDAFDNKGIETVVYSAQSSHISDIITDVLESEYICVGSPTLNNNILPTVAAFLTYLKGLAPKGRKAIAFGSFGWSGQSPDIVAEYLTSSGFQLLDTIKFKFIPDNSDLSAITKQIEANMIQN
ncbi:MAG: MBL fold metallo-hydrolase [Spirochaetes bacterium GWF1_31_7]|nr:MAG: MBL fold metallo-hydrolase [Spirochaetes bacterium GWE1_32_154]OHD46931.1 MAG: MBL fold metallo-hydrolase [Spirochaetes bacterium GWF1_31_7]OHD48709.1 MAG: MBL fold metallo-hydrolase [Spirochaetes bacterium GWE2_31_10]OHD82602.1 MAG: MBL fold metallo-hydrolase [Spirochaetes bacterium RIFOXYB1_FULL_32_8]HBD95562.1 MBL fold metallo-hydrolase [Spirochaetia bacterium]